MAFFFALTRLVCFTGKTQSNLAARYVQTTLEAGEVGQDRVDGVVHQMLLAQEVREDSVLDDYSDDSDNSSRYRDSSVDPGNVISGNYDDQYFFSESDSDDEDYVPISTRTTRAASAAKTTQKPTKNTSKKTSEKSTAPTQTRQRRSASNR